MVKKEFSGYVLFLCMLNSRLRRFSLKTGRVAELVDALDSKSCGSNTVRVQVPPRPPENKERAAGSLFIF